ncbi:PQQ-binding-like beta-propeller repeat protein [Sphingomonas sp. LaA6.9]|uniref:outer membrane protein assembly factor BamB family protein n=1 Tax=Sphingomonas sp. LaA6.9 TaxID=2919914 RepID=UPI001F4F4322|nr:PQQ-binding-like beta-propeller repeat protein [Sphingomonas sp. LaA6.9]MCJ8158242.1 PQQ-binding-like beta-propeller repeat protein [Sphingomonas sp. LaA6.9]
MTLVRNGVLVAVSAILLGGCSILGGGEDNKPKTPTVGKRVPVLTAESGVEVDPALADVAVLLPMAAVNAEWTQPGGNASKSMGHLALGASLSPAWTAEMAGSSKYERLASTPIVAEGRVYAVDSRAKLRAYDAQTGAEVWTVQIGDPKDVEGGRSFWSGELSGNVGLLFGGGVSYDNGMLYATNGIGDVAAFNAQTGAQLWKKRPGGPLRGAPGVGNGNVYVMSQDNQIFALRMSDGNQEWTRAGTLETAGVFGVASPAIAQGTVVGGYSSGELSAYRYENGQEVWQDALSRTSIATAVGILSDIDADPVIDQGRVFAVGQGGRMVSLELVTGQRLWEINIAGISTPWVAGEWVFVVTDEAKLLCLSRVSGKVRWQAQLTRYRNPKKKEGPISWQGPVLAGDRLVLVSNDGMLAEVSPTDGAIRGQRELKSAVNLPPIVANNTLYILDDSGRLTAWR